MYWCSTRQKSRTMLQYSTPTIDPRRSLKCMSPQTVPHTTWHILNTVRLHCQTPTLMPVSQAAFSWWSLIQPCQDANSGPSARDAETLTTKPPWCGHSNRGSSINCTIDIMSELWHKYLGNLDQHLGWHTSPTPCRRRTVSGISAGSVESGYRSRSRCFHTRAGPSCR